MLGRNVFQIHRIAIIDATMRKIQNKSLNKFALNSRKRCKWKKVACFKKDTEKREANERKGLISRVVGILNADLKKLWLERYSIHIFLHFHLKCNYYWRLFYGSYWCLLNAIINMSSGKKIEFWKFFPTAQPLILMVPMYVCRKLNHWKDNSKVVRNKWNIISHIESSIV